MKYLTRDFLYYWLFCIIFGIAGYLFSAGNPFVAFFCFLVCIWMQDVQKLKEIIRQKDKEIEILNYETYDEPEIKRIKKLAIDVMNEELSKEEKQKIQTTRMIWIIILTILPIVIYLLTPKLMDRYLESLSGNLSYVSTDHYFSFSPNFLLDLPYFLPPIIWAIALWLGIKTRKEAGNKSYGLVALITLNSIFLFYSAWFINTYFS